MRYPVRVLATISLLVAIGAAGYGFTAYNAVSPTNAGFGSETINGSTVSDVNFTLASVNTLLLASVEFKLDKPAAVVKARFDLDSGSRTAWSFACALSGGVWTCNVPPVHIGSIIGLEVLAYQ